MADKKTDVPVYQMKVALKEIKPPVWRRFVVNSDITLYKLHQILQAIMGWSGCHLYQFVVGTNYSGRKSYGDPDPDYMDDDMKSARRARLNQMAPEEGSKLIYEYDFGDGWEHDVVVEKILPPQPDLLHPVCIKGKRATPPEDCGGVFGYYRMLEILADPEDEEYEDMVAWLGGGYDPEQFDPDSINEELKIIKI